MVVPSLPEEILLEIFSNLMPVEITNQIGQLKWEDCREPAPSSQALSRLSRCSKKFRRIALPLLYRTILMETLRSFLDLIGTLLEHPELRPLIKNLRTHIYESSLTNSEDERASRIFLAAHKQFGIEPQHETTIDATALFTINKAQALLIRLCPDLRSLDVKIYISSEFIWDVLREVDESNADSGNTVFQRLPAGHLSQLRKLRLEGTFWHEELSFMLLPRQLPKLVSLIFCKPFLFRHGTPTCTPGTAPALRYLNLIQPELSEQQLVDLFGCYPNLKLLQLEQFTSTRVNHLTSALRRQGYPSLESLVIHYNGDDFYGGVDYFEHARALDQVGDISVLSSLKRLSLPLRCLVDDVARQIWTARRAGGAADPRPRRHLPRSLECLEVQANWANAYVLRHFHFEVLRGLTGAELPNLRRILLQVQTRGATWLGYERPGTSRGCWRLITYVPNECVPIYNLLDGCPRLEHGSLQIEHGEYREPPALDIW
ncbi:hypothetical protein GGR52DRAFT_591473 [Hypoxylon sp. FL1284]|nr:hypothetical protein GGR52DRAFT_591473 [Hypoxylon sp. FL1284]